MSISLDYLDVRREILDLRKLLSSTWKSPQYNDDKYRAKYRELNYKISKNFEKLLQVHNRNITLETEVEQFIKELDL